MKLTVSLRDKLPKLTQEADNLNSHICIKETEFLVNYKFICLLGREKMENSVLDTFIVENNSFVLQS